MKIGVLGTGMVGETIASKLVSLGHDVKMGSRTATHPGAMAWAKGKGAKATCGTFTDAAAFGEVLFNCTSGVGTLSALQMAGPAALADKILVDISNPLDFSKGMPPTLFVCNTDSLAEQIQRAYPSLKVVKSLNTMWCGIMVNPRLVADSHTVFLAGNDPKAKSKVTELLTSFGWKKDECLDLGDIKAARGMEASVLLWVAIWGGKDGVFNFKVARPKK